MFKNIRNRWITEKTQTLKFHDTLRDITAKWNDLTPLCKLFCDSARNMTKVNYQALYPERLERQKNPLVVNVFNEKTVVALNIHGYKETSVFVRQITRMWNILNVKSPKKLNEVK